MDYNWEELGALIKEGVKAISQTRGITVGEAYRIIGDDLSLSGETIRYWTRKERQKPLTQPEINKVVRSCLLNASGLDNKWMMGLFNANGMGEGSLDIDLKMKLLSDEELSETKIDLEKLLKEIENKSKISSNDEMQKLAREHKALKDALESVQQQHENNEAIQDNEFDERIDEEDNDIVEESFYEVKKFNNALKDYLNGQYFPDSSNVYVSREPVISVDKGLLLVGQAGTGKFPEVFELLKFSSESGYMLRLFLNPEIAEECQSISDVVCYWCEKFDDVNDEILLGLDLNRVYICFDDIHRLPTRSLDVWSVNLDGASGWLATSRTELTKLHHYNVVSADREFMGGIVRNVLGNRPELIDVIDWLPTNHHASIFIKYFVRWENLSAFIRIWNEKSPAPSMWQVAEAIWNERILRAKIPHTQADFVMQTQMETTAKIMDMESDNAEILFLDGTGTLHRDQIDYSLWVRSGLVSVEKGVYKFSNKLVFDYFVMKEIFNDIETRTFNKLDTLEAAWILNYYLGRAT